MTDRLSIGRVAAATGVKVQTIRYYEEIGLLARPARTAGNQRYYDDDQVRRLAFIRHARELGFSLASIRELLSLSDDPGRSCASADAIARACLADVERRIARLSALRLELERMIEHCRGGRIAECRVIEVLGDHELCLAARHGQAEALPPA
jgi:Cu(I)-responsive transcriptional regulator